MGVDLDTRERQFAWQAPPCTPPSLVFMSSHGLNSTDSGYDDLLNSLIGNTTHTSDAHEQAIPKANEQLQDSNSNGASDVLIGVAVGAVATIALLLAAFLYYRHQRKKARAKENENDASSRNDLGQYANPTTSEKSVQGEAGAPALSEDEALLAVRGSSS